MGAYNGLFDAGIFDHIVQHGGHQALVIHVHVGQNPCDRQRMGNIGLTTAPQLPKVGLLGEVVGAFYLVGLFGAKIAPEGRVEGIYGLHSIQ